MKMFDASSSNEWQNVFSAHMLRSERPAASSVENDNDNESERSTSASSHGGQREEDGSGWRTHLNHCDDVFVPKPHPLIRRGHVAENDWKFLESLTAGVLDSLDPDAESCHVMVFGHGAPCSSIDSERQRNGLFSTAVTRRLLEISRDLIMQFEDKAMLLSVRLLVAPPGCPPQGWHLDFRAHAGLEAQTVFAALTPCTRENCTEVLLPISPEVVSMLDRSIEQVDDAVDAGGIRPVPVSRQDVSLEPLIIEKFGVACVNTSRLPHRRGPTMDARHTRVVLNCDFTTCSPEEVHKIGFVDDDAVTAWYQGGVVGRSVVDDLHSEVVIDLVD